VVCLCLSVCLFVCECVRVPCLTWMMGVQAVAMEQELQRQIETNRANVDQQVAHLLTEQQQVRIALPSTPPTHTRTHTCASWPRGGPS
jgi:hypothetical protein